MLAQRFLSLLVTYFLLCGPVVTSQNQKAQKQKPKKQSDAGLTATEGTTPTSAQTGIQTEEQRGKARQFEGRLALALDPASVELNDYVPCFFTVSQLQNLRPTPPTPLLTGEEAETFKQRVISVTLAPENADAFENGAESAFISGLVATNLEGLTPSEALSKTIDLMRKAVTEQMKADTELQGSLRNLAKRAEKESSAEPIGKPEAQALVETASKMFLQSSSLNEATAGTYKSQFDPDKLAQLSPGKAWAAIQDTNNSYLVSAQKNLADSTAKLSKATTEQDKKVAQDAVKTAQAQIAGTEKVQKELETTPSNESTKAIIASAKATLSVFKRPPDIACAMSILSWNEVRHSYGRLLADEYIAVQIVVRNINEKQEFLLHDAELGVDTDLSGRKGRYFSGRDKVIVRAMSLADADFSRRNILVHLAESVGTLMSTVVPIAGSMFGDAASVYNGGFLPGLNKSWPSHNTDHLNLLNDTGFSSASNFKTAVPKSGTVMFVLFVPSKQFEQGWWLQKCAETMSNGILINSSSKNSKPGLKASPADNVGINLEAAFDACEKGGPGSAPGGTPATTPSPFEAIHFKKWRPNALAIFRELAFAVVAGTHVDEAALNKPLLSTIDCPRNGSGDIDMSQGVSGTLNCKVTGVRLDNVTKIRLRNADKALDNKTAEGDLTISGDSSSGNVAFPLSQLGTLSNGAYKSYPITKDALEGDPGPTLHFGVDPLVTTTEPVDINLAEDSGDKAKTITLAGFRLDSVKAVVLRSDDPRIELQFSVTDAKPTSASFTFDLAKKTDLSDAQKTALAKGFTDKPVELVIFLQTSDSAATPIKTSAKVRLTGKWVPPSVNGSQAAPAAGAGTSNDSANSGGGGKNGAKKPGPKNDNKDGAKKPPPGAGIGS